MKTLARTALAVSGFLAAAITAPVTSARAELPARPYLPLPLAQKMIDACFALAKEKGWSMHIVVRDAGDDLKAYVRMDGAGLSAQTVAMKKASASATTGWSTAQVAQFAFNDKGQPTAMAFMGDIPLIAGGLPITSADGDHLGGIGVSGARPDQDEACAKAALEAVTDDLK